MCHSRRQTAALLGAFLLLAASACSSGPGAKGGPDVRSAPLLAEDRIVGVVTTSGDAVRFDLDATLTGECVEGRVNGVPVSLPAASVQRYWVENRRYGAFKTLGLPAALSVTDFAGASLAIQSCPFVYSWDGSRYVLDAEPWGGAVTRGLERTDDAVLASLRAADGRYHLLVTNEVAQTQQVDHLSLRVVDHAPGVAVVAEASGKLRGVKAPIRLTSARTSSGEDLAPWLVASDDLVWEPPPSVGPGGSTRDELVVTFPKYDCSSRALLIVNGGTSLFGSRMIGESLALRGRDLPNWYAAMDASPDEVDAFRAWADRDELWTVKIDVLEPTGWETRGVLHGGGPLVGRERAVLLELGRVVGNTLSVRVRPPRGYWAFNSFGVVYGEEPIEVQEVQVAEARDAAGRDHQSALVAQDRTYDEIPPGAGPIQLSFDVPPQAAGTDRSVVLHARGFYRLALAPTWEPDLSALERLATEPGFGVRLAAERWERWTAERAAAATRAPLP